MRTLFANGWIVTMDDAGTEHPHGWVLVEEALTGCPHTPLATPAGCAARSRPRSACSRGTTSLPKRSSSSSIGLKWIKNSSTPRAW